MNNIVVKEGFDYGRNLMDGILSGPIKTTQPGSLKHLLWGENRSEQSMVIKFGRNFEKWFEFFIKHEKSPTNLTLLPSGVHRETKTDRDLLAIDEARKFVYYRELKANIELDTEKLPATIEKIKRVKEHLKAEYSGYKIDAGCLCWSTYDEIALARKFKSKINSFQKASVTLDFAEDFFEFIGVPMKKQTYYDYFKELGRKIRNG